MTEVNKKVNLDNPVDTGSSSKQRSRSAAKEIEKLILGRAPRPGAQLNARAAHKATPNKRSRAGLGASSRVLRGTVSVNPRGFGFVTSEDGGDAFIPPKLVTDSRLVDGDIVRVLCYSEQDRLTVTKINEVTQTRTRLFGVAQRISAGWVLRSDPWLSSLSWRLEPNGVLYSEGDAVTALIVGSRVKAITNHGPATATAALHARALERARVAETIIDTQVRSSTAPKSAKRVDLTELNTFSIDGPESQDLDDALSVRREENGVVTLFVHVADVAAKVALGSELDKRAQALGTSVYLPGKVITMLDAGLSFDECSLLAGKLRDTLTVELQIDPSGDVVSSKVYESRIRSNQRLTYTQVAGMLRGTEQLAGEVGDAVALAHVVSARLGAARAARGGLRAQRIEPVRVIVTEYGLSLEGPDDAGVAHDLIEEAMVAANEAVAQWLVQRGLRGVYRTHAAPGPEAAESLETFAAGLGVVAVLGSTLTPRSLAALERQLEERGLEDSGIWEALIGKLGRASYQAQPSPHFGLASEAYVQFTSPIRRYGDLGVHRIVKAALHGAEHTDVDLVELCIGLDQATERASRAERIATTLLSLKWLQDHQPNGTRVQGRIIAAGNRGALVRLDSVDVRGWVRPPGTGRFEVSTDELLLTRGALRWSVGQALEVVVGDVDLEAANVELSAVSPSSHRAKRHHK